MQANIEAPLVERWRNPSTPIPGAPSPERAGAASSVVSPPPVAARPSWTRDFLDGSGSTRALVQKSLTGLGLAALYGVALGARDGGLALLVHAAGVPAALLAVTLLGLPALFIVLALFDAPLSAKKAAAGAATALASAGLVLAGLAPLAALYVVTSESTTAAAGAGFAGLMVGGLLGLRHLVKTLREALAEADSTTRFMGTATQVGFALFAIVLAFRVWTGLLPLLGGGS